jgi:hypothetical protein
LSFSDFFDRLGDLDWLAVVVGTIVFMVIGWIWYGPLFGKQWSAASGQQMESGMPALDKMITMFVYTFIFNAGINFFGVTDNFEYALVAAILFGIFLVGSMAYSDVLWAGKNRTAYFYDLGFVFVGVAVAYYVQGLMA